jgi:hypothetical protein
MADGADAVGVGVGDPDGDDAGGAPVAFGGSVVPGDAVAPGNAVARGGDVVPGAAVGPGVGLTVCPGAGVAVGLGVGVAVGVAAVGRGVGRAVGAGGVGVGVGMGCPFEIVTEKRFVNPMSSVQSILLYTSATHAVFPFGKPVTRMANRSTWSSGSPRRTLATFAARKRTIVVPAAPALLLAVQLEPAGSEVTVATPTENADGATITMQPIAPAAPPSAVLVATNAIGVS